jgi:hypothetical protein
MSETIERLLNIRRLKSSKKNDYDNQYFVVNETRTTRSVKTLLSNRKRIIESLNDPKLGKETKKQLKNELSQVNDVLKQTTSELISSTTYIGDDEDLSEMYPNIKKNEVPTVDLPVDLFPSNLPFSLFEDEYVNEIPILFGDKRIYPVKVSSIDIDEFPDTFKKYTKLVSKRRRKFKTLSTKELSKLDSKINDYKNYFKAIQNNVPDLNNSLVLKRRRRPLVIDKNLQIDLKEDIYSTIYGNEMKSPTTGTNNKTPLSAKDVVNDFGILIGDRVVGSVRVPSVIIDDYTKAVGEYASLVYKLKRSFKKISANPEKLAEINSAIIDYKNYFKDVKETVAGFTNPTVLKLNSLDLDEKLLKYIDLNELASTVSGKGGSLSPKKITQEKPFDSSVNNLLDLYFSDDVVLNDLPSTVVVSGKNESISPLKISQEKPVYANSDLLNTYLNNKTGLRSVIELMLSSNTVAEGMMQYYELYEEFLNVNKQTIDQLCRENKPDLENNLYTIYNPINNNPPIDILRYELTKLFDSQLYSEINKFGKNVKLDCGSILSNYDKLTTSEWEGTFIDPKSFENFTLNKLSDKFVFDYLNYVKNLLSKLYYECQRKTNDNKDIIMELQNDIKKFISLDGSRFIYINSFVDSIPDEYTNQLNDMYYKWVSGMNPVNCLQQFTRKEPLTITPRLSRAGWSSSDFESPITNDDRAYILSLTERLLKAGYDLSKSSPTLQLTDDMQSSLKIFAKAYDNAIEDITESSTPLKTVVSDLATLSESGREFANSLLNNGKSEIAIDVADTSNKINEFISPVKSEVLLRYSAPTTPVSLNKRDSPVMNELKSFLDAYNTLNSNVNKDKNINLADLSKISKTGRDLATSLRNEGYTNEADEVSKSIADLEKLSSTTPSSSKKKVTFFTGDITNDITKRILSNRTELTPVNTYIPGASPMLSYDATAEERTPAFTVDYEVLSPRIDSRPGGLNERDQRDRQVVAQRDLDRQLKMVEDERFANVGDLTKAMDANIAALNTVSDLRRA